MGKQIWKPGNMLYPLPVVMVSVSGHDNPGGGRTKSGGGGCPNIITVAWAGTVCTNPPMISISIRPERYSYALINDSGEFVINLTTRELVYAADYCGVTSGRDVDKFRKLSLTALPAEHVRAPLIAESPVNIECRVTQVLKLGSHDMFLAKVLAIHAQEAYLDEKGRFCLEQACPVVYSHGTYYNLGEPAGTFGFSVRKQKSR